MYVCVAYNRSSIQYLPIGAYSLAFISGIKDQCGGMGAPYRDISKQEKYDFVEVSVKMFNASPQINRQHQQQYTLGCVMVLLQP